MSDVTDPEVRSKSKETEQDSREGIFNYEFTFCSGGYAKNKQTPSLNNLLNYKVI